MSLFDDPGWHGGAGGKKQKKQPAQHIPFEDPDTISSNQIGVIVDIISEGPIEGIVGGLDGVYLDETPATVGGIPNFRFLQFEERTGTENQTPVTSGAGVENEVPVNVRLKYGIPVIRDITSPGVDGVRVQLGFGGLAWQDMATGDTHGSTVAVQLDAAAVGDSFPGPGAYTIGVGGKSRSRFTQSYWIARPPGSGAWRLKVYRVTADSTSASLINETFLDSYTEVISAKPSYPFSALAAVGIRADEFSSIPSRGYHVKGLRIKVPTNSFPEDVDGVGLDAYHGDWDGQFKIAYSNNPAWIWMDLATNERYGLGQHVRLEHIDKWALYRIGRHCDELVETGFTDGGVYALHERRFVMNLVLQSREQAYKVLSDMASVFRGMVYWSTGLITFSQDTLKNPIHQFTPANIKDGVYSYASSSRTARHTVILARWNNPNNYYLPETEYIEDEAGILRYGVRPLDVTAFGTTSRGQAHRLGRWMLATERLEKETVSFQTGLEAATLRPGDIINIVDPMRGGKRFGGRIKAGTIYHIELDEPVTLEPGIVYEVSVLQGGNIEVISAPNNASLLVLAAPLAAADLTRVFVNADADADGTYETPVEVRTYDEVTRTLSIGDLGGSGADINYRVSYVLGMVSRTVTSDPGTTDSLWVSPHFDVPPEAGQVWMLAEPNLVPSPYRVVSVQETERGLFSVVALQYAETKFAEADTGIVLDEPPPGVTPPTDLLIGPPSALSVVAEMRVGASGPRAFLSLAWTAPSPRVRVYRVRWRLNLGNWQSLPETTATEVSLSDARPGFYDFEVVAVSVLGQVSRAATIGYAYDEQTPVELSRVTGLELDGLGNAVLFTGHDARFAWRWNEPNLVLSVEDPPVGPPAWFAGFVVRIVDPLTNTVVRTEPTQADPHYVYTLEKNQDDGGPRRSFRIEVGVRDVYGRVGPYAQLTVSNPAPAALMGLRLTGGFREVWIDFEPSRDADYRGVLIWASSNENFSVGPDTLVCEGAGHPQTFPAEPGIRYWVRIAAYDAFGMEPESLNVSGAMYVDTRVVGALDFDALAVGSLAVVDFVADSAHIGELAVKTLHIAGNAVTNFSHSEISYPRCIIAPLADGDGEVGQGTWVNVLSAKLISTGTGPAFVTGLLYAQVLKCFPNALLQIALYLEYGQRFPRIRYQVIRTQESPAGDPAVVFASDPTSISMPGYALAGVVSSMDAPGPGVWNYQLQVRWERDVYDVGLITINETYFQSRDGYYWRYVTSTGGTRWLSNMGPNEELWANVPGIGFVKIGVPSNGSQTWTDSKVAVCYPPGSIPPYYSGHLAYEARRPATTLKVELNPKSFMTIMEFRK